MSTAKKYKHYKVESTDPQKIKKDIEDLKSSISQKLSRDTVLQKKAALIIQKMIRTK